MILPLQVLIHSAVVLIQLLFVYPGFAVSWGLRVQDVYSAQQYQRMGYSRSHSIDDTVEVQDGQKT